MKDKQQSPIKHICTTILNCLEMTYGSQMSADQIRLGIGMALSTTHSALLSSAKTEEQKEWALTQVLDTQERLVAMFAADCKRYDYKNVEFVFNQTDSDESTLH